MTSGAIIRSVQVPEARRRYSNTIKHTVANLAAIGLEAMTSGFGLAPLASAERSALYFRERRVDSRPIAGEGALIFRPGVECLTSIPAERDMNRRELHRTASFGMISRREFGWLCCGLYPMTCATQAVARNSRSIDLITIEHGWAQLGIDGPGTTTVYLTISNESDSDDYLLAVDSDVATSTMIHDAKKQPIPLGLVIPGYNRVIMEPKGFHMLLSGVSKGVATVKLLPVRIVLRDAGSLDFSVPLVSQ